MQSICLEHGECHWSSKCWRVNYSWGGCRTFEISRTRHYTDWIGDIFPNIGWRSCEFANRYVVLLFCNVINITVSHRPQPTCTNSVHFGYTLRPAVSVRFWFVCVAVCLLRLLQLSFSTFFVFCRKKDSTDQGATVNESHNRNFPFDFQVFALPSRTVVNFTRHYKYKKWLISTV